MTKGNVAETFAAMQDDWNPRIAGELNGQQVKLGKFAGEFSWHDHAGEDEVFLLVRGFGMEFWDRTVAVEAGEFLIVPRGVAHRHGSVAVDEAGGGTDMIVRCDWLVFWWS
jgi:mannose-6-phosphate isomerase-like protein (cupin superfamily)